MSSPWIGFDAVDASGDAAAHAAYLARLAEFVRPIRIEALSRLGIGPGTCLLDAGCGLGEVVIDLAERVAPGGRVVGLDASREMIDRAAAARVAAGVDAEFVVGSVTDLPFESDTFDVTRSERVFQHLDTTQQAAAAAELVRVTRPGGYIQISDPNHRQWALAATDRELAWSATEFVGTRGRSPEAGSLNSGLLSQAGATEIDVTLVPIRLSSVSMWFTTLALEGWMEELIATGRATTARAAAFFTDLADRERSGIFLATSLAYIVTARRPG